MYFSQLNECKYYHPTLLEHIKRLEDLEHYELVLEQKIIKFALISIIADFFICHYKIFLIKKL